ncbi:DMT family transporter, partial [Candidatus Woesearchaeota archaeon]|nr:DMT family transporter [Candidatus Woesearchaeota archaeon]
MEEWFVFAIICAVLTGVAAILQKKNLHHNHTLEFSATLAIVNMIISIPLLLKADFSVISQELLFIIILGSITATGGFFFMAKAVHHMELSHASPFLTFGPVIVAFLAFAFLGETLTFIQVLGILLVLFGAYFLEIEEKQWAEPFKALRKSKYIKYIFLSLLIYGFGTVIDRVVLADTGRYAIDPALYIGVIHIFIAINFVFLVFLLSDGFKSLKTSFEITGAWIILLSLITVGYRFFQSVAVQITDNVALVSVIKRSSVFIPIVLGGKIFREENLFKKTVAS